MKKIFVISVALVASIGIAQDPEDYRATMRAFLANVGRTDTVDVLTFSGLGDRVEGEGADYSVSVNVQENVVTFWSDDRRDVNPRTGEEASKMIRSEAQARDSAQLWLETIGAPSFPLEKTETRENRGVVYEYVVVFKERPNGYRAPSANYTSVSLNAFSGVVVTYLRATGYSFDAPDVSITEQQAELAARRRIQQVFGVLPETLVVEELAYLTPGRGGLAERAFTRDEQKRARLAYRVFATVQVVGRIQDVAMSVDAKSGLVIDGGVTKAVGSSADDIRPTARESEEAAADDKYVAREASSRRFGFPFAFAAGTLAIIAALFFFRKSRP